MSNEEELLLRNCFVNVILNYNPQLTPNFATSLASELVSFTQTWDKEIDNNPDKISVRADKIRSWIRDNVTTVEEGKSMTAFC